MATDLEICNMALMEIGVKTITSMSEASEAARRLTLIYPSSRDKVLRDHTWNFATQIESLSEVAGVSIVGWSFVYAYPAKCLFVRKVYNPGCFDNRDEQNFKEVYLSATNARAIACNLEEALVEYTYQITDPAIFDASFVKAFSLYLASCLAQALSSDKSLASQKESQYYRELDIARGSNKSEGREIPDRSSSYEDAR